MPEYVLLRHDYPNNDPRPSHWDLMLEHEGALWTWALDALPLEWEALVLGSVSGSVSELESGAGGVLRSSRCISYAERLADHRLAYLEYEGAVSGGRGSVRRCCRGMYQTVAADQGRVVADCVGPLVGELILERDSSDASRWRVLWNSGESAVDPD